MTTPPLLLWEKGLGDEVKCVKRDLTPAVGHPSPTGEGKSSFIGFLCFNKFFNRGVAQSGSNRGLGPPVARKAQGHCEAARRAAPRMGDVNVS